MSARNSVGMRLWMCVSLLAACGVGSPLATGSPVGEADAGTIAGEQDAAASHPSATSGDKDKDKDGAESTGSASTRGRGACGTGGNCDPIDLGGESCESLGLGGGMLLCDPTSCTFVVSLCVGLGTEIPRLGPPCGTGPGCDPADLGDNSCESLGLGAGVLSCDPLTCMFDTSMCERLGTGVGGTGSGPGPDGGP